jgi:hypothetical protein
MGHVPELNALVNDATPGRVVSQQVSPGLLLVAYGHTQRALVAKLGAERNPVPTEAMSELPEKVRQLALAGSEHNCIILGSVFYAGDWEPVLLPGTTPFLWWPLDRRALRALAMANVTVVTAFNPAHLLAKLQSKGFVVERFKPPGDFALSFRERTKTLTLENFSYFLQLVYMSLLSEDYVIDLVVRATQDSSMRPAGNYPRMDLRFVHQLY